MLKAVVDRFEENKAVLLLGKSETKIIFPKQYLPDSIKEGDFITIEINYDEVSTQAARKESQDLLDAVKKSSN